MSRRRLLLVSLIVGLLLLIVLYFLHFSPSPSSHFDACPASPPSPSPDFVVPNVIHFVHFDSPSLSFVSFICVLAAFKNQNPDSIRFHTNLPPEELRQDPLFAQLLDLLGPDTLRVEKASKPSHVFGIRLGSAFHAADVFRLHLGAKDGGIFLDEDAFLVRNLDAFRRFDATLGWPEGQYLGTQVLLFRPDAPFVKLWLESYKDYRPSLWYYNAGQLPTEAILQKCPGLVRREKELFGVQNLADELYRQNWAGWRDYYSIHLLARHRSYLAEDDVVESGVDEFNLENIKHYNRTFGFMARDVLKQFHLL